MRKLIVQTFVTLDGVMQAPGGPGEDDDGGFAHGGWSVNYWDDQMEVVMSDLDEFLASTIARQVEAEEAIHNGDPGPRLAMWSTKDPVTVLGAVRSVSGWDEVSQLFRWLGSGFSDCSSYRFELLAAGVSGDLAYTVGHEHTSVSWDGIPLDPYTLRVTHVYRREEGEWKIVHRHADSIRSDRPPLPLAERGAGG